MVTISVYFIDRREDSCFQEKKEFFVFPTPFGRFLNGMNRSRLLVAMALAFSLISLLIGIIQIGVQSRESRFSTPTSNFLTAGQAGIARIDIIGTIEDGYSSPGSTGAQDVVDQIEEASQSASIRGILLYVNSPGGTVGATRRIYDALMEVRAKKPIVAVVTDVAASGGYYIASTADAIFAYESSILGSIGAIAIHPNIGPFLDKHGVQIQTLTAGRYKDSSYPFRNLTEEERQMYQQVLDDAYQQFLADVAEGRKKSIKDVREWADGKIYSGRQAKAIQMIDDLGGEKEAVEKLKIILKTDEDLPVYRVEPDFMDRFFANVGGGGIQMRNAESEIAASPFRFSGVLYMAPMGLGQLPGWMALDSARGVR
ncbi:MAG: signal peptide peptidase SppA [Spirochaetaceae bacterium]|nr:signal peptide peptidase SppA [Spirochaetaceae bacterium]